MANPASTWPLGEPPAGGDSVVVASQGVRIWTSVCRVESFDGALHLQCSDQTMFENLRHQRRVAFTVLRQLSTSVHGSGMVRLVNGSGGQATLLLEPYRLSAGPADYELRLGGWQLITEAPFSGQSRLSFWYRAFRGVTLPLSAIPVALGTAVAFSRGNFNWLLFILSLVGATSAHAGANATADYFDFKNGVDSSTALSSHLGALARERVEPETILIAAFACFMITALMGLVLVQMVGWALLLFGLAGLAGAFFYTGRPLSYKYRGLGELTLGVLMGPVIMMGSYFVQTRGWGWDAFLLSTALALLVSSISLANNLRDIPDDKAAGITTLPMLLGASRSKKLYYGLTVGPYAVLGLSVLLNPSLWPLVIVALSIPQALRTVRDLHATTDEIEDIRQHASRHPFPLNSIRLHLRFGVLAVLGIVAAGLIRIFR